MAVRNHTVQVELHAGLCPNKECVKIVCLGAFAVSPKSEFMSQCRL